MAKIAIRPTIQGEITLALSMEEAAALDAIAGYGVEAFLKVFYPQMGEAYLKPYEKGLRSLFESVHRGEASVSGFIQRVKDARAIMDGTKDYYVSKAERK